MNRRQPRVSIGLPVYNGGSTLARAIRCYLEQDYEDLELIVSDNASTDGSGEICNEFARSDSRVLYSCCATNQGAVANFNRVFRLARGEYFKWAAHDDWCAGSLVSRCVEVLDATPRAVLCQSQASLVHEDGRVLQRLMDPHDLSSPDPVERFHHILWKMGHAYNTYIMFGLARQQALAATNLLTRDMGSDRVLLGGLSLMGELRQIPEPLQFLGEVHSARAAPRDSSYWAPENSARLTLLSWRLAKGFATAVLQSNLSSANKGVLLADIAARYGICNMPRLAYETYLTAGEVIHRKPYKTMASSGGSYWRRW